MTVDSKSRWLLVAASAVAFGLCASLANGQEQVTITFANWAAAEGATRPGIEQTIADFEAAHPNINVESEAISFLEIAQQLVLRVNAGNPPDVAEIAGNDTFLLAATGAVEPLGSYLDSDLESALNPTSIDVLQFEGELIALPWTEAPVGFWYNKKIMKAAGLDPENPPQTIDELMTGLAAIKSSQPDVIPLALDTTNRPFGLTSNWPWMLAFGAVPVGESGTGANSPEMKQYLEWMRELAQKGYIDPGRKIGEFRPLAAQDKVAFIWDQVLLQGVIQSTNNASDAEFYGTWGVTTQPVGAAGKPFAFDGGHQLVMFANSESKEAAWEFMKYLATSPDAIKNYTVGYESSLPPLRDTSGGDYGTLDTPVFGVFSKEIAPTVARQPYGPAYATASTAIMAGVQEAITGMQPIDEIAASMQQQLDRQN